MSFSDFKKWIHHENENKARTWLQSNVLTHGDYRILCMSLCHKDDNQSGLEFIHRLTQRPDGKVCHRLANALVSLAAEDDTPEGKVSGPCTNFLYRYDFLDPRLPDFDFHIECLPTVIEDFLSQLHEERTPCDPNLTTLIVIFPFWRDFYIKEMGARILYDLLLGTVSIPDLAGLMSSYLNATDDLRVMISPLGMGIADDLIHILTSRDSIAFFLRLMQESFGNESQRKRFVHFLNKQWNWMYSIGSVSLLDTEKNVFRYRGVAYWRECNTFHERLQWLTLLFTLYREECLDLRAM